MYFKEFEIRWSDVDANRHMANSAYINFMAHSRMSFLLELGYNQSVLAEHNIGPVVFYEHMYYFKEMFPGKPIKVSVEVVGMSEDGKFFEFEHNFYDSKGVNRGRGEMMGAWMDLKTRKLIGLPDFLLDSFKTIEKPENYKVLTKEDTRRFVKIPKDLK